MAAVKRKETGVCLHFSGGLIAISSDGDRDVCFYVQSEAPVSSGSRVNPDKATVWYCSSLLPFLTFTEPLNSFCSYQHVLVCPPWNTENVFFRTKRKFYSFAIVCCKFHTGAAIIQPWSICSLTPGMLHIYYSPEARPHTTLYNVRLEAGSSVEITCYVSWPQTWGESWLQFLSQWKVKDRIIVNKFQSKHIIASKWNGF